MDEKTNGANLDFSATGVAPKMKQTGRRQKNGMKFIIKWETG